MELQPAELVATIHEVMVRLNVLMGLFGRQLSWQLNPTNLIYRSGRQYYQMRCIPYALFYVPPLIAHHMNVSFLFNVNHQVVYQSHLGTSTVFLKRKVRNSKYEPYVEEVELIEANPEYAHVKFPNGRESTVSLRDLAPGIRANLVTNPGGVSDDMSNSVVFVTFFLFKLSLS